MMKVGSLVELSAYGKKIQILQRFVGQTGLVLQYNFESALVQWSNSPRAVHANRRDIKEVKV